MEVSISLAESLVVLDCRVGFGKEHDVCMWDSWDQHPGTSTRGSAPGDQNRVSHPKLLVESAECVAHDVELMSQLLHYAENAGCVLEHVHTLGVGVVVHSERPLDGLSELPVQHTKLHHTRGCVLFFF